MTKKTYLFIAILVLAVTAGGIFYFNYKPIRQIACTQEAKQCPDGSYVGRTGPNCEFAPCPNTTTTGSIRGKVTLGPTCPVMRIPPDPACADKPYKTTVQIIAINSPKSSPFAVVETDDQGRFKITLPPGEYGIQPMGGNPLPRCETKNITVEPDTMIDVNLSCDTGIR